MTYTYFFGGIVRKKLGVFQNSKGEWIMGTDVNNGACCETKEVAEQLLALHNKYYYKKVNFTLKGEKVEGRITEVGLHHVNNTLEVEPWVYVRYKNAKYRMPEADCTLI
jgi:hypothetical protein